MEGMINLEYLAAVECNKLDFPISICLDLKITTEWARHGAVHLLFKHSSD